MIKISNLCLDFKNEAGEVRRVLKDVNLSLPSQGLVFLLGKSGSGKTSLLHCLGGLLPPTMGEIVVNGRKIDYKNVNALSQYRRDEIAFVFQDYNLLGDFSALENLEISGCSSSDASKIMDDVGLGGKEKTRVRLLSGGEQQRLAIGRALGKGSPIFLLDEPTANLDESNAEAIFTILQRISKKRLVLVATHDTENARRFGDYVCEIRDGYVSGNPDAKEKISCAKEMDHRPLPSFPFKNRVAYSWSLLRAHRGRAIATLISTALTAVLLFTQSSLLFFDEAGAACRSLAASGLDWTPVSKTERNENLSEDVSIECGKYLYNQIQKTTGNDPLVSHMGQFRSRVHPSDYVDALVYVIDRPTTIFGKKFEVPETNVYYASSFIFDYFRCSTENVCFGNSDSVDNDLVFGGYTVQDYDAELLKKFRSGTYNSSDLDEITYLQTSAVISKTTYDILSKDNTLFSMPGPILNDVALKEGKRIPTITYMDKADSVDTYLYGETPKNGEIALSEPYVKEYLKSTDSSLTEPSDLVGQEVVMPDLELSPNAVSLRDEMNPIEVGNRFKVSGIVSGSRRNYCAILNPEAFQKVKELSFYYGLDCHIFAPVFNKTEMRVLMDSNYHISTNAGSMLSAISTVLKKDMNIVFWIVEGILGLVCLLLLCITCDVNVREKWKEICVLDSLGVKQREIRSPFLLLNGGQVISGFVLGFVLCFPALFGLNKAMMSSGWFALNFDLLAFSPISLPIVLLLGVFAFLISTILPLVRVRTKNLSVGLRTF